MIHFNKPAITGSEQTYLLQLMEGLKFSGDGSYTMKCSEWLQEEFGIVQALLTTSCTHALEMAALLMGTEPGDEIIMPSYTFVSTANAFVLRGARIVFVDIRPDTMNMDESLIEQAITTKTKAIVPVHYAGVACDMDTIMAIANKHGLIVIEDAAQAIWSQYHGRDLGTIGQFGCFSFHETKNIHCGEGGALFINDESHRDKAEIIREKGTNRSRFYRGEIDKYSWVDMGSSYLPSELNAAFLLAQLENGNDIIRDRLSRWEQYYQHLEPLQASGRITLPTIPDGCIHNGHMFYVKVKDLDERTALLSFLKEHQVFATFHYVPLHSSQGGQRFGRFHGEDRYTTSESERLIRLPLYYQMGDSEINRVIDLIYTFYAAIS